MEKLKECPHCKEQIKKSASRCPHCGGEQPHGLVFNLWVLTFALCTIGFLLSFIGIGIPILLIGGFVAIITAVATVLKGLVWLMLRNRKLEDRVVSIKKANYTNNRK